MALVQLGTARSIALLDAGPSALTATFLSLGNPEAIAPTRLTDGTTLVPLRRSRDTSSCQVLSVWSFKAARVSV